MLFVFNALCADNLPDKSSAGLQATDSGWQVTAGEIVERDKAAVLSAGTELKRTASLKPGLYELQIKGSGNGMFTISGGVRKRTIQAAGEPGIYGLLFEVTQAGNVEFTLKYKGSRTNRFVIASTVLVPADAERQAAWAAAKKSYELLGYFGTDPQRRAPGSAKASGVAAVFSREEIERSAIRETVVFHDSGYDAVWVDGDAEVAAFFTRRGLAARNAVETEAWLKARSEGDKGVGSSIIFTMGTAPANIVYQPYDDCLLAKYLRAGGRVVWMANLPMVIGQGVSGPTFSNTTEAGGSGGAPAEAMLGLSRDKQIFYGVPGPTFTAAAKAWGLEPGLSLVRPFHAGGVTVPFVTDPKGDYCGVGLVSLRGDVPFSGLIFVPDQASPKNEALLRNVYRFARYSGKPVEIPPVATSSEWTLPLEVSLRFGSENQRMVYLRGETVPLVLRIHSLKPGIGRIQVSYALREGDAILCKGTSEISVATQEKDESLGYLNLSDLRAGRYMLTVTIDSNGKTLELSRELRIAPLPDHRGTHVAIWCSASTKMKRTEDLLDDLEAHNLAPLFADKLALGRDLALWYGFSFSTRRHGQAENVQNPPGYSNDRLGSSGQILKVRSQGDKRASKGYASPLRRQAEADDFKTQIEFDNIFPAFRQRTVTADDYSQWFGLDYNRYAVEGFRACYGFEPPRPKGSEDPYCTVSIERALGIIPDDDPWIQLNRYWSETLGDSGRRLSQAMEAATGGAGKVGPVPGGMQLPLLNMASGQYPPFNFGAKNGFNLSSFYYYNSFWQPLLTHLWWLECARMGNRGIEQWMMPDCYQLHFESFYRNSFWLMMAGGVHGLPYFHYPERQPEPMNALKDFGALSRRYGLMLEQLRPAQKKVAMLVPFENVTYRVENGYGMAYPFMNLLLAKIDVEPVSPDELDVNNIRSYDTVVLGQTKWLKAGTVKMLEDYIANGGKVVLDSITAAAIPVKGAATLGFPFGEEGVTQYGRAEAIARVRQAMLPIARPPVDCDQPYVTVRRAVLPDGTPGAWLASNLTQDEYAKLKAAKDANPTEARALEDKLGYRREIVNTTLAREDDGRIPFDVFGGRALEATRAGGRMTVKIDIPKWEGKLLVFLPSLPSKLEIAGVPSETKPGMPVHLEFSVCDKTGAAISTPMPLQLTVRDPQGKENREYSRRLLTDKGRASTSFTFASNDLEGVWVLEIQDVLTGIKATRELRMKH